MVAQWLLPNGRATVGDMGQFKATKIVGSLPTGAAIIPDCLYVHRIGEGFDLYCSTKAGVLHKINTADAEAINNQRELYNGLFYNGSFQVDSAWTNPPNFAVHDAHPFGARKSLWANTGNIGMRYITDAMPVAPNHVYRVALETKKLSGTPRFYCGIAEFDVLNRPIIASTAMRLADTDSLLTQDLNDGDTVVHLDAVPNGWTVPYTQTYRNGFIFYTENINGFHYKRDLVPYSRDFHFDLFTQAGINQTAKTITLKAPWDKGLRPAGTEVSRTNAGGYYNYLMASAMYNPDNWTNIIKYIGGGITTNGTLDDTRFRPGTATIRLFLMFNALNKGESLYSNAWFERTQSTRANFGLS